MSTKTCPECGGDRLALFTSLRKKYCTECYAWFDWERDPGQKPLIGPAREMTRKRRKGRPVDPTSVRQRLKAEGIPSRSFYTVRDELKDSGIEASVTDIIDICKARRRQGGTS